MFASPIASKRRLRAKTPATPPVHLWRGPVFNGVATPRSRQFGLAESFRMASCTPKTPAGPPMSPFTPMSIAQLTPALTPRARALETGEPVRWWEDEELAECIYDDLSLDEVAMARELLRSNGYRVVKSICDQQTTQVLEVRHNHCEHRLAAKITRRARAEPQVHMTQVAMQRGCQSVLPLHACAPSALYTSEELDSVAIVVYPLGSDPVLCEDNVLEVFLEATQALAEVHRCGIVLCDHKLDNLLVMANGKMTVIDLESAVTVDSGYANTCPLTTWQLAAPEIEQKGCSFASDMYTHGVVMLTEALYEFGVDLNELNQFLRERPAEFEQCNTIDDILTVCAELDEGLLDVMDLLPLAVSDAIRNTTQRCVALRWTAQQVCDHLQEALNQEAHGIAQMQDQARRQAYQPQLQPQHHQPLQQLHANALNAHGQLQQGAVKQLNAIPFCLDAENY